MHQSLRTRIDDRERGVALILVIGIGAVLAVLVVAAVSYSLGGLRKARSDQDWNAAMAAAYAGVEEYQSRLADDTGYSVRGNPLSPFSNPTGATPAPVTLPTGAATNPAFGLGTTGTWAQVPGSDGDGDGVGDAQFRYEVDNSRYASDGVVRLRSTGRAGGETRTIVAELKQQGFIDFLYFTDYEVVDPTALNPTSTLNCAIRYPGSRPGCQSLQFGTQDVIEGDLHTNDAILVSGSPRFNGKTTTAYRATSGPNYLTSGGATPAFAVVGDPEVKPVIGMPATNAELKKETRTDVAGVSNPGCLYTGPTSITFHDDGTMTVVSPWTKATRTSDATDTAGTAEPECGRPGAAGLGKVENGAYVGERIAVYPNMVIYVQNVPTAAGNVNATAGTTPPDGAVACPAQGNALGYPRANEVLPFADAYGCRNGDVFVQGELEGRATVAAQNYIYVTGDLTYEDQTDDMLGLVGNNAVWIWNPVQLHDPQSPLTQNQAVALYNQGYSCYWNGDNPATFGCYTFKQQLTDSQRTVHAAILSVAHTFMVQNYDKGVGSRGTLHIKGAIAQKFRGAVGRSGSGAGLLTGYAKDYRYDERFKYVTPPKFLAPVTTFYGVNTWAEVSPAMNADGSLRD